MEKTISVEERIRRAEEIYNKRNGQYINHRSDKSVRRKASSVKKLLMQTFVCLMIYLAFYVFSNSNYIFSEQFLNQVKGTFGTESNIYSMYLKAKSYIEDIFSTDSKEEVENKEENINNENKEQTNNEEAIGGAEEALEKEKQEDEKQKKEDTSKEKTQMEKDADEIKSKISFINPISGRISSTFGWRTPTTKTVPKYHTGLDIAAETGTIIKSATEGKVILASSEGDYGNHYKIQTGDITIIYAHCNKLYLKEGDKVKQGDKIAEVGSTGNSTGPHLHFEIRIEDRLVDPQLIINI